MSQPIMVRQLAALSITCDNFRPYGQLISATLDGKPFGEEDAQLHLSEGIPRFYIMRLEQRGRSFFQITRHQRCTQCLGSLAGQEWLIAVAPASEADCPDPESITAFRVPGDCFIKLEIGTWHAGPYFEQQSIDFYNLELSDTNLTDHQTCNLRKHYGLEFEILT
jgi:ureidoglycolate hydrolase